MTLYQDAHVPTGMTQFEGMHQPACCWNDVYDALMSAQQLICITGWSVWTELQLFRGPNARDKRTLGQILKDKAKEGVRVHVMVWDEATTGKNQMNPLEMVASMGTHDEETYSYFKDSGSYLAYYGVGWGKFTTKL